MTDFGTYVYDYIRDGQKYELQKIKQLLELLGNPQKDFKAVHISGTNGKGSTSTYIEHILREQGLNVGKFTSPHLVDYTERIRFNLQEISKEDFKTILPDIEEASNIIEENFGTKPSFFEMITAIAYKFFSYKKVDWAVIEVGLGGRLDATNTLDRSISVVTNIDFDHTGILGDKLEDIAFEKVNILKKDSVLITAEKRDLIKKIFKDFSNNINSKMYSLGDSFNIDIKERNFDSQIFDYYGNEKIDNIKISMAGDHQVENAALAVRVAEELKISSDIIKEGIKNAVYPGRLEIISRNPLIIMDGAHNKSGLISLKKYIDTHFSNFNIVFLSSILRDKNADVFYRELSKYGDSIFLTSINNKRVMYMEKMKTTAKKYFKKVYSYNNSIEAYNDAKTQLNKYNNDNSVMIITGSLYLLGELKDKI